MHSKSVTSGDRGNFSFSTVPGASAGGTPTSNQSRVTSRVPHNNSFIYASTSTLTGPWSPLVLCRSTSVNARSAGCPRRSCVHISDVSLGHRP